MKIISNINIFDLRYDCREPTHFFFEQIIQVSEEENYVKSHRLGYICIPTNGRYNSGGLAVMGAGLAKDAANKFPELPEKLGRLLMNFNNQVFRFSKEKIFIFPTKNDWREKSNLDIITKSCRQLRTLVDINKIHRPIYLPKVGCGLGGLSWNKVEPILKGELNSDQYIILE